MIFATYWFIIAVALFLPLFWLIKNSNVRFFLLAIFCIVFHTHFAGPAGVLPIVVIGVATYFIGLSRNVRACEFGIFLSVLALCFYKYTHFLVNDVLAHFNSGLASHVDKSVTLFLPAAPPLAISFFAFEFIHYLYEVRKGKEPIKGALDFVQFALFFPSLVAGPIKRYTNFLPSLRHGLGASNSRDIGQGALQVACGFFKKSVIADNLTLYITANGPRFAALSMPERWLFVAAVTMRVYMDFSGYSDMAIGFARMLGIQLPQNFNWPYLACSLQELWQRWHISLSSWIRDYVYIPLGGSKKGPARKAANGLLAFALCGLWHGAAWNFVLWGLSAGIGLAINSSYRKLLGPVGQRLGWFFDRAPAVSWALTISYFSFGLMLFFYPTDQALHMVKLLFVGSF